MYDEEHENNTELQCVLCMHAKWDYKLEKSFKNNLVLFAVEKADFLCSSQVKYSCIFRNSRVIRWRWSCGHLLLKDSIIYVDNCQKSVWEPKQPQ